MAAPDPRQSVEAPVRRELAGLVVRGLGLVGIVAGLAILPVVRPLDVATRDAIAVAVAAILFGFGFLVQGRHAVLGRTTPEARDAAWSRAAEVDAADAALGLLISRWVPIGLLLSLGVLLWPHFTDPNPALACAWVVLGLPPVTIAWLFSSSTWLDACRDDLARALGESDARFRRYWANPGR